MNTSKTQIDWAELKGRIKQKWTKFADDEIEGFKENMHLIPSKLQTKYGYTKDRANREYEDLNESLRIFMRGKPQLSRDQLGDT